MRVNLNDKVKFRITDQGKDILNVYFIKCKEYYHMSKELVDLIKDQYNSEVIEMTLWEFMNIFGPSQYCGSDSISENNEVEICQN